MAIMMQMRWEGVTPEQYDTVRDRVNWEGDAPTGGLLHVAAFDGNTLLVNDAWDSAEDFQRFVDTRLMPAVQQVGIQGEPQVEIYPAHRYYNPGLDKGQAGS